MCDTVIEFYPILGWIIFIHIPVTFAQWIISVYCFWPSKQHKILSGKCDTCTRMLPIKSTSSLPLKKFLMLANGDNKWTWYISCLLLLNGNSFKFTLIHCMTTFFLNWFLIRTKGTWSLCEGCHEVYHWYKQSANLRVPKTYQCFLSSWPQRKLQVQTNLINLWVDNVLASTLPELWSCSRHIHVCITRLSRLW